MREGEARGGEEDGETYKAQPRGVAGVPRGNVEGGRQGMTRDLLTERNQTPLAGGPGAAPVGCASGVFVEAGDGLHFHADGHVEVRARWSVERVEDFLSSDKTEDAPETQAALHLAKQFRSVS